MKAYSASLLLLGASLVSCVCTRTGTRDASPPTPPDVAVRDLAAGFVLDTAQAEADLIKLTEAPHPFGSPRQAEIASYLETRIAGFHAATVRDRFVAETPNPAALQTSAPVAASLSKTGFNIIGTGTLAPAGPCVVALGSHYDTKTVDGIRYVGANDSGSSTAVLLQQLAYLKDSAAKNQNADTVCDIIGIFFDGEEPILPNWNDGILSHPAKIQDNTYGSRSIASRLAPCSYEGLKLLCLPPELGGKPLIALVLMDMIGSPDLQISRDGNSSAKLIAVASEGAASLGSPHIYDGPGAMRSIEDDHIPFRQAKVAAIDLIDFNNTAYWHTHGDEITNLSYPSMELAGRLALYVALKAAKAPKVFAESAE